MFKNQTGQVRSGWLILLAFIIMFAAQVIFTIPGTIMLVISQGIIEDGGISIDIDGANEWVFLLTNGIGTLGGLIAILLVWRFINRQTFSRIGLSWNGKDLSFGLLLGAISITFMFCVLYTTGNITLLNGLLEPEFSIFTLLFLLLFILVGLLEEIFFRGYIMSTMASRNNKKWVIYVVSADRKSVV